MFSTPLTSKPPPFSTSSILVPGSRVKMEFHHAHHEQEQDQEEEEEEDVEMTQALPINTTYGGHNHILPLSLHHPPPNMSTISPAAPPPEEISKKMVVVVRYKECLKNHAASMGGKATDGCGEFMASGEEGSLEALICSVCNCHRNFHRKEMEGDYHHHHHNHNHIIPTTSYDYINYHNATPHLKRLDLGNGRNLILHPHHHHHQNGGGSLVPYGMGMGGGGFRSESEEQAAAVGQQQVVKKRFRTKFTQEQKEKMVNFAEKVGWKIQRQEESVVQQFCQEIGIKRRVLKVWMHNNKQNLAKNMSNNSISINPSQPQPQTQTQHQDPN